jgi:hypothetical protein
MAEIEKALRRQPNEPHSARHSRPDLTCGAISVLGRFNSLIVDFVSLFAGFISPFGRVGNCPRRSHNINDLSTQLGRLTARNRVFAVSFRRPGNPIPPNLLGHKAIQPIEKMEHVAGSDRAGSALRHCAASFTFAGEPISQLLKSYLSAISVRQRTSGQAEGLSDANPMRPHQQESGFCRAIFGARHPSISTLSATTRTRPSAIKRTVSG